MVNYNSSKAIPCCSVKHKRSSIKKDFFPNDPLPKICTRLCDFLEHILWSWLNKYFWSKCNFCFLFLLVRLRRNIKKQLWQHVSCVGADVVTITSLYNNPISRRLVSTASSCFFARQFSNFSSVKRREKSEQQKKNIFRLDKLKFDKNILDD